MALGRTPVIDRCTPIDATAAFRPHSRPNLADADDREPRPQSAFIWQAELTASAPTWCMLLAQKPREGRGCSRHTPGRCGQFPHAGRVPFASATPHLRRLPTPSRRAATPSRPASRLSTKLPMRDAAGERSAITVRGMAASDHGAWRLRSIRTARLHFVIHNFALIPCRRMDVSRLDRWRSSGTTLSGMTHQRRQRRRGGHCSLTSGPILAQRPLVHRRWHGRGKSLRIGDRFRHDALRHDLRRRYQPQLRHDLQDQH
jgi:hypothetical protein